MSRARELAKAGGVQQRIAGFSSHVGMSTFLAAVHMENNLTVDGNANVGGNLTVTGTTTFNGGTLTLGDANTDNVVFGGEVDSNIIPDDDNSFDLGSASKEWKDIYVDGVAYLDSVESDGGSFGNIQVGETGDNEIDTGSGNLTLDSAGGTVAVDDNLTVSGSATVTGGVIANGDVDLGNATSDTITATGRFDSDIVPSTDNARDLGASGLEFKDLYLDGTANIDSLVADTADINGGSVDGATIGSASASTAAFTTISASGNVDFNADLDVDGTTNLDVVDIDGAVDMASNLVIAGNIDANGDLDVDGTTNLDVVDIDGAVDMATTLTLGGNADFNGDLDVDGTSNLDVVDIDGAVDMATTLTLGGNADFNGALDVDGHTNLDNVSIAGVSTFASGVTITGALDANGGASIDNIQIGVTGDNEIDTASGNLTLDSAGGTVTVDDNLTVSGNLTVNGTTTTINSTTVAIDDKNFQVATGAADDAAADGAGLTVDSGDGDKTFNFEATGDNWGASENLNLASGKAYKINNASILNATTLGSSVVASSLTSVGTIATGVWNGTAITNANLANSSVSYGGISLSLGGTDATPAFDLSDATNYPTSSLSGTITNTQLAGSIANGKLANSTVSYGGISLSLGGTDATPAFDLSDATNYPTSSLSGTITNAQLAGSIEGTKLENSGVTANQYGSSTAIPIITVDAQGLVTAASTTAVDSTTIENGTASVAVASNGPITSTGNHDFTAGIDVTGNITVSGTVDGRDVASDGSKLDGIESSATADQTAAEIRALVESASDSNVFTDSDHSKLNAIEASATADQTASEILTLIKTVDGSGSGLDADTLDGISSASFLRSDTSDTFSGTLTVSGNILPNANGTRDLGANGTRWANVYSSDLDLSNQAKGSNSVDGTWGSYLIEEGEDHLFLTNRRNGKKYRFMVEEV